MQAVEAAATVSHVVPMLTLRAVLLSVFCAADAARDSRVAPLTLARLMVIELFKIGTPRTHVVTLVHVRHQISIRHRQVQRSISLQFADLAAFCAPWEECMARSALTRSCEERIVASAVPFAILGPLVPASRTITLTLTAVWSQIAVLLRVTPRANVC